MESFCSLRTVPRTTTKTQNMFQALTNDSENEEQHNDKEDKGDQDIENDKFEKDEKAKSIQKQKMIRIKKKAWRKVQADSEMIKGKQLSPIKTIEPDNIKKVTTDGRWEEIELAVDSGARGVASKRP